MDNPRVQECRVRITDHRRPDEPDRWLAPGAALPWRYVDRPDDAGVWPRREAAQLANEYRRGQAWRGRASTIEPVNTGG